MSSAGTLDPEHVPKFLIVRDAIAMALLEDVPPEVTICQRGTPMVRFCGLIRQTAATGPLVLKDGSKDTPLPPVIRWYRSDENKNRILSKGGIRRLGEVENITLHNDFPSKNPDPAALRSKRPGLPGGRAWGDRKTAARALTSSSQVLYYERRRLPGA